MPKRELPPPELEASTQILIAEHQRLSELYLYNAEMGERRTSMYLTVVSLGGAGLIGLAQIMDSSFLFWPATGLLFGMLVLGLLTFQRLIERRMRAVENLRAINRIHRYFVDKDLELVAYLYWPPCDDVPAFRGKGAALAGLRDIVALLNSLFGGFLLGEALASAADGLPILVPFFAGLALALLMWFLHQYYENASLRRAERHAERHDVRFPRAAFSGEVEQVNSEAAS